MYEFITIGGGQYFVDFFNGVASLVKSEDYLDVVKIAGIVAFMWVLFSAAFAGSLEVAVKWFVTAFLVTQALLLPKATLHITDKTNTALNGATVDNVPFFLAYVASASSQIGYSLTKQFETVYSLPNDLKYQQNGMIFGVNLMETMNAATIYNSRFSESMHSFVKECIFYDLLLDNYSFDDLKSASDIWALITPLQSENRFFTYLTLGSAADYPSCKDGVSKLEADWVKELGNWSNPASTKINFLSAASNFGKTKADLRKTILTSLNANGELVNNYLLGISMNAQTMLKQAMTINAIQAATESYEAEYNQQQYQNARATMQARSTYQTMGRQAGHWIPILKIVIESIFYASFPIVVLLSIIPNLTVGVLRGYFTTFFWLASWGPIYAILNRIMSEYAANHMTDGSAGLTMLNQHNIQAVTGDVSAMAGYLAMFVPMIAYGLAKGGAAAMSSMTTSFLSVAQGAATSAANEGVTGNLSFANVGIGNRQIHSGVTMQNDAGQLIHHNQNGSSSMSRGTSESDTGYDLHASQRLENNLSKSISEEKSLAESAGIQSQELKSKGYESMIQNHRSIESSEQYSKQFTAEQREAFQHSTSKINEFANSHRISEGKAAKIFASVSLGKAVGIGVDGNISAEDAKTYEDAKKFSESNNLSKDLQTIQAAVQQHHLNLTDSKGQSINDTFNQSQQLSHEKSTHLEKAQRFNNQKQYIEANSASVDRTYNQEFYNYVKDNLAGGDSGKTAEMFNPNNNNRHEILDKSATEFLQSKFEKANISENFEQDYKQQATRFISQNGPKNLLQNEPQGKFKNEYKSINNSDLKQFAGDKFSETQKIVSDTKIDESAKGEVIKQEKKGVLVGLGEETKEVLTDFGNYMKELADKDQ